MDTSHVDSLSDTEHQLDDLSDHVDLDALCENGSFRRNSSDKSHTSINNAVVPNAPHMDPLVDQPLSNPAQVGSYFTNHPVDPVQAEPFALDPLDFFNVNHVSPVQPDPFVVDPLDCFGSFPANPIAINPVHVHPVVIDPVPVDPKVKKTKEPTIFFDMARNELYLEVREDELGHGGYGHVHEVIHKDEGRMALKMPNLKTTKLMIDREIKMLERVKRGGGHDNIVTFLGTVDDIQGTGLLFELCNPRSFWTLLCARGALQEFEVRYFGRQLLEGLKHIHDLGLIHCDLKPDNVLIGNGMVLKIADFGLAEDSEEQENMLRGERTGTPGFNAPEVALMGKHTFALDIYSIGCIFYQMITGQLANLTTFIAAPPMPKDFFLKFTASRDAKDMLRQTLQYDVKKRLKLPSLINHNFFREGYCPRMLPETVFDEQPSHAELEALDQQLQQKEEIAALEDYQNVNLKRQHDGIEIELEGDQTSSDEDGHSAKMKRQRKGKEVQRDQAERETETVEQDQVQLDVTKKKAKAVRRFKIKRRGVMEFLKDLEREEKKLKEMFGDDLNLQSSGDNGDNDDDDDA